MIPASYKIKTHQFPTVLKGKSIFSEYFRLIINQPSNNIKIGVVVSKKNTKTIVLRNLIKRTVFKTIKETYKGFQKNNYIFLLIKKLPPQPKDLNQKKYHQQLVTLIEKDIIYLIKKILKI